jgi:hypothetical protein
MLHHRMKLALAILAALLIVPGTTQAQFSFGHFGDFSSAQGAPAQFSTTAPGLYASGQYLTAGPWDSPLGNMDQPGPYPIVRITQGAHQNIYILPTPANGYSQNPYRAYPNGANSNANASGQGLSNPYSPYEPGTAPAYAAPRPVNPITPPPVRWRKDLDRYYYNRGFEAGYNAGLMPTSAARPPASQPFAFGGY